MWASRAFRQSRGNFFIIPGFLWYFKKSFFAEMRDACDLADEGWIQVVTCAAIRLGLNVQAALGGIRESEQGRTKMGWFWDF
jgi:hypothetical protein